MKRSGLILLITFAALIANTALAATLIQNSKHNLSSTSSASIRSTVGGTSQICVFCHTPHSANPNVDAPLWNRGTSTSAYTVYSSDVMNQLGIFAEPPGGGAGATTHVKSRICLSCHDGTIALGQLANYPSGLSDRVPMQEGGLPKGQNYTMPQAVQGYIGVDLRDDHPVAVLQNNGPDPELNASIAGNKVHLYYTDSGDGRVKPTTSAGPINYVECTSCHNPHDNENGNFLVEPNTGSTICIRCHSKETGAAPSPAHDNSSTPYNPDGTGSLGTTVGTSTGVMCMNCHFPHKAGTKDTSKLPRADPNPDLAINPTSKVGYYLLTYQEEMSCFNNKTRWNVSGITACHGSGSLAKNIEGLVGLAQGYAHRVGLNAYQGRHEATEGSGGLNGWINQPSSLASWHVECQDCHNPHTAGTATHNEGTNQIGNSSALYGTYGVDVQAGGWPTWVFPAGGSYTYLKGIGVTTPGANVTAEYQICFKCHTDFAWGMGPGFPDSPSWGMGTPMTNQAVEFNPSNTAFHPVTQTNSNIQGTGSRRPPWNVEGMTMYCSDCHTNNMGVPMGPHGSGNQFILKRPFNDAAGTLGGSIEQPSGDLCFDCHLPTTYLNSSLADTSQTGFRTLAGTNLHATHVYRANTANPPGPLGVNPRIGYKCVNCHTRIPHGGWNTAMIVQQGEGAMYGAQYEAAGGSKIIFFTLNTGNYAVASCSTIPGCHTN